MVQSAIVILQETARCCSSLVFGHIAKTISTSETVSLPRLPSAGGVYSPGYAFADTSLVARFLFHLQMIQNCSVPPLQKRTYINNAQFSFIQVEQKGGYIHICGGGYLILSARNIRPCFNATH